MSYSAHVSVCTSICLFTYKRSSVPQYSMSITGCLIQQDSEIVSVLEQGIQQCSPGPENQNLCNMILIFHYALHSSVCSLSPYELTGSYTRVFLCFYFSQFHLQQVQTTPQTEMFSAPPRYIILKSFTLVYKCITQQRLFYQVEHHIW